MIAENSGSGDAFAFIQQIDWTAKWHKKFTTRAAVGMASHKVLNPMLPSISRFKTEQNNAISTIKNKQNRL